MQLLTNTSCNEQSVPERRTPSGHQQLIPARQQKDERRKGQRLTAKSQNDKKLK